MSDSVSITSSQRSGEYTTIKKGARITNAEIDALETYQITLGINESLRKGEPLENNDDYIDEKKLFKNLKSLLSKSRINETMTVYRGIKIGYDNMEEVLEYFKQSPVIKEFLSTTVDKSVATHFMGGGKYVRYNKERDVFYPMFGHSIDKSEVDKHDIIKKGKDTFLRDRFPCCFFEIELPKGTNAVYLPDFNTITGGTLEEFSEENEILVMPGGRLMYLGSRVEVGKEFEHYPARKTNKKEKEDLVSSRTVYQFRYVQNIQKKSAKRSKSKASPKRSKSKVSPKRSKSKASPKRSKSKASPKRSKSKAKKDCPEGQTRDRITKECRPKKAPGRPKKV